MNHLSDNQLLAAIENLVSRERELLNDVLLHLREIDRRKLFSKLGYPSLIAYAMEKLKYSPDQAGRRIAAMRLLREIPEAEAKVIDGSLTLSTLAQAHWHFNKNNFSSFEKRELLAKLENATKKQTIAILKQDDKVRYSFEADEQTENEIERLRALNPHLHFDQLIKKIVKMALEQTDPEKKIERSLARKTNNAQAFTSAVKVANDGGAHAVKNSDRTSEVSKMPRYISAALKREVWRKAKGKCESCKSAFALEYDHKLPIAKGGQSELKNLRLLCRNCNQRKAVEVFGVNKMNQFRESKLRPC